MVAVIIDMNIYACSYLEGLVVAPGHPRDLFNLPEHSLHDGAGLAGAGAPGIAARAPLRQYATCIMCIYVHVYVYEFVSMGVCVACMYMHIHVHTCVYSCTQICASVCMHMCMCIYI